MADKSGIQTKDPCDKADKMEIETATKDVKEEIDCFGRPGSQIDEKIEFKNQYGESVYGVPVIIDFRRVMQLSQLGQVNASEGVIAGVSNRDLLHAVVGLYDISLSDMESETIYTTVCARWARTIVLVQDLKDAVDVVTEQKIKKKTKVKKGDEAETADWRSRINENDNILKEDEPVVSAFLEAFSDTEEEEEEEEDEGEEEEEEENFSKGIHTFINETIERRKQRDLCNGILQPSMIGIENRLLGCVTFERKFVAHKERVIHLTLISVRPRYHKFRIGRYLLSKCVSPVVVGNHDAVVVHADNSAVDFFRKFGFSDDVILNSKWSDLADAFTNCTLMSFLPGFTGHSLLSTNVTKEKDPDIYEIDQELRSWQTKSREAYQGQLCCMMKFRHEILQLKHLVKSQNELLNKLVSDHDKVRRDKLQVERDLLTLQLQTAQVNLSQAAQDVPAAPEPPPPVLPPVEKPLAPFSAETNSEIITRFTEGMEMDRSINVRYCVTSISKAPNNPDLRSKFQSCLNRLQDPDLVTELYFAGSLEKPGRLPQILNSGFGEEDFTHGEFGHGLYFTKYPSKAAQFSALGKLLEVRVGLGRVETVMKYDRTRKCPTKGHNSIISPGRLYRPGDQGEAAMLCQEYVVFDVSQVLPLCVITYSANPSA